MLNVTLPPGIEKRERTLGSRLFDPKKNDFGAAGPGFRIIGAALINWRHCEEQLYGSESPGDARTGGFRNIIADLARSARLREMMVQGSLQPGERVREVPLAQRIGVSRIPLHLALERLAHEGLLEPAGKRGFIVRSITADDIHDSIDVRGVLEGSAARLAAERLESREELRGMAALAQEMVTLVRKQKLTSEHMRKYIDLNAKFHDELLELAKSRTLRRAIERACTMPFASPSSFFEGQYASAELRHLFVIAADQHLGIVEAIGDRESARAESLAREHARTARRSVDEALHDRAIPANLARTGL